MESVGSQIRHECDIKDSRVWCIFHLSYGHDPLCRGPIRIMMWGMSFVAVFNAVSDFGFHTANIKSVAKGRDQNACFSSYFAVKMILTMIMVAVSV
jgi:hypothetical protein